MKSNYTFANKCLIHSLLLCLLLVSLIVPTVGCGLPEIVQSINTASSVVSAAGGILSAVNPADGAILGAASVSLKLLAKLIQDYQASVAAGKPGIATQIQAVIATITGNLTNVLSAVRVKNAELVQYIQVAVAIANSVVTAVIGLLPVSGVQPQAAVLAQAQALPTVQWKTHKDLKAQWNNAVKGHFAHATV